MPSTPEKNIGAPRMPEAAPSRVVQPVKLDLTNQLGSILEEVNRISESAADNPAEQWSGKTGTAAATKTATVSAAISARERAIAHIPEPAVMQKELEKHIKTEVKKLRRQAQAIARISHPGAAYRLNEIYARIRKMNALLSELLEASYEVLKRFFIRVFIDKQPIL